MKRKTRIALAFGLVAALFMAGHAAPASADDGSPDGMATQGSPDPCTLVETRKVNLEIAQEERDQAWDKYSEKHAQWWFAIPYQDSQSQTHTEFQETVRQMISEFPEIPDHGSCEAAYPYIYISDPHGPQFREENHLAQQLLVCAAEWYIDQLETLAESLSDAGSDDLAGRARELADEWRSHLEDWIAAYETMERAWDEYEQEEAQVEYFEAKLSEAEERCTSLIGNISELSTRWPNVDLPWGFLTPELASMPQGLPLAPMQDPMGSDANRASNETQYVIPFGIHEQPPQPATGQVAMPEADTPAVTPSRARLFNTPPERHAPGAIEAMPAATGQVMQVDQSGSSNTGTSSFGYTHMPLPQNTGQTGAVVAPPPKSLRFINPMRRIGVNPARSFKR